MWPYCIPVLLLPLERDSELLRERESVLRLRERRWLDGASFDTERGSTSREGEPSLDKKSIPVQSPVSLGEELQWWPDKVGGAQTQLLIWKTYTFLFQDALETSTRSKFIYLDS